MEILECNLPAFVPGPDALLADALAALIESDADLKDYSNGKIRRIRFDDLLSRSFSAPCIAVRPGGLAFDERTGGDFLVTVRLVVHLITKPHKAEVEDQYLRERILWAIVMLIRRQSDGTGVLTDDAGKPLCQAMTQFQIIPAPSQIGTGLLSSQMEVWFPRRTSVMEWQ